MRDMGLQGDIRGKIRQDYSQRQGRTMPVGSRQPKVQGAAAGCPLALRVHLCRDLERLRLRRLRDRRLCPQDRHSDRGSQYVSIKYTERLAEAGVEPSVGSVGDSYDNALAETINGLYKAEVIHRRGPWRNFEAAEFATFEWVDWFNNPRLLSPLATYRQPKPSNAIAPCWNNRPGRHNLNQKASGNPGAVQLDPVAFPRVFFACSRM